MFQRNITNNTVQHARMMKRVSASSKSNGIISLRLERLLTRITERQGIFKLQRTSSHVTNIFKRVVDIFLRDAIQSVVHVVVSAGQVGDATERLAETDDLTRVGQALKKEDG